MPVFRAAQRTAAELCAGHLDRAARRNRRGACARCRPTRTRRDGRRPPVAGDAYRLKPGTRIGLWRGANNMPGGWLKWMFERYGFNHRVSPRQTSPAISRQVRRDRPAGHQPCDDRQRTRSGAARQGVRLGLRRRRRRMEEAGRVGARWRHAGGHRSGGRDRARAARSPRSRRGAAGSGAAADRGGASASADAALKLVLLSRARCSPTTSTPRTRLAFGMPASWPVFFNPIRPTA